MNEELSQNSQEKATPRSEMMALIDEVKTELPDLDTLTLNSLDTLALSVEEEVGFEIECATNLIYRLADEIDKLKFENSAQKDEFIKRICEMLRTISRLELNKLYTSREATKSALTEFLQTSKVMDESITAFGDKNNWDIEETNFEQRAFEISVTQESNCAELERALDGRNTFQLTIPDATTLSRLRSTLGTKNSAFLKDEKPPITFPVKKHIDGKLYIFNAEKSALMLRVGCIPLVVGMNVSGRRSVYFEHEKKTEAVEFTSTSEENTKRIDQIIPDPLLDRASIMYGAESIKKYSKYPEFQFKAGDEIYLVRGKGNMFYFANEQVADARIYTPNYQLPRAFVFNGDQLEYENKAEIITQEEAMLALDDMDGRLHDALEIKKIAAEIETKFGIKIGYNAADLADLRNEYKEKHTYDLANLKSHDPHVLKAYLESILAMLEEFGVTYVRNSGLKILYITQRLEFVNKKGDVKRLEGENYTQGKLVLVNLDAFYHEFTHCAETATMTADMIADVDEHNENSWYAGHHDGHDHEEEAGQSALSADYSRQLHELSEEEQEELFLLGVTSLYAKAKGEHSADEIQAEIADFLLSYPDAFKVLGQKTESGEYKYTQLRYNCQRILQFHHTRSEGEIDKKWWERHRSETITDDEIFAFSSSQNPEPEKVS